MTILVDTNVVLDVLAQREPFWPEAAAVLSAAERGDCRALLGATTITTLHYLLRKPLGAAAARSALQTLLSYCGLAAVDEAVLQRALASALPDFEDAVLHEAARQAGAAAIITRNQADFVGADLPILSPAEFLALLALP